MNTGPREATRNGEGGVRELLLATILDWPSPRGEQVSYRSRGVCLVFGPSARVGAALSRWPAGLRPLAFGDDGEIPTATPAEHEHCHVGVIQSLRGHLGTFRAEVVIGQEARDVGPLSPNSNGLFDLVLDLRDQPLLDREVPPPGYWHCPASDQRLDQILNRLSRRVGLLAKPRYYDYDRQLCAYDRQGVAGCRHCLSVCPAEAIRGGEGAIAVDSHLCQGCGSCTQACPNGAIRFAWPDRSVMLQRIDQLIRGYVRLGQRPPAILFYRDSVRHPKRLLPLCAALPDEILPIPLHEVGSVGIEVWLAALALGASDLFIENAPSAPATAHAQLNQTLDMATGILDALGIESSRITLLSLDGDTAPSLHDTALPAHRPATWQDDKRGVLLQAMRALSPSAEEKAIVVRGFSSRGLGDLRLRDERCTLCGACARLCPVSALRIQEARSLLFEASRCTQCGLCVQACPENALELDDQFRLEQHARVVHQDTQLAHCTRCGEPFSSQRLVDKSIAVLETLPSFEARQSDLLRMCPTCRQSAAFEQE